MMEMTTPTTEMMIKSAITYVRGAVVITALLFSMALFSGAASAQTQTRMPVDRVVEALATTGFEVEHISRTWLGRIRIEATNGSVTRELIVNRVTGEVLRDYWEDDHDDDHDDEDEDDDEDDGPGDDGDDD